MNRKLLRITLIGLVALVALAAAWPALSAAVGFKVQTVKNVKTLGTQLDNTYYPGACEAPHAGVTLVVDYGSLRSGKPVVRCALHHGTDQLTGWSLFSAAGFKVAGTSDYPTGFVCRINGLPAQSQQDCLHTPTVAEGTWQYFVVGNSGSWKFSMMGAAMSHPKCGEVQGWRFVKISDGPGPYPPRATPKTAMCD